MIIYHRVKIMKRIIMSILFVLLVLSIVGCDRLDRIENKIRNTRVYNLRKENQRDIEKNYK